MPYNRGWAQENHSSVWRRGRGLIPILPGIGILIVLLSGAGALYTTVHKGWATFIVITAMVVIAAMTDKEKGGG
jgi:hypothetical protein